MAHRFTTEKGIELIKHFEGFHETPYLCLGGFLTIGYGHKLLPSDRYNKVSIKKAEAILIKDIFRIERAVLKYIAVGLNDNQFDSLVSFTFNLGAASLQRSTLRQKINYNIYDDLKPEFLKWVYAGGKKVRGLVRRRTAESNLFYS